MIKLIGNRRFENIHLRKSNLLLTIIAGSLMACISDSPKEKTIGLIGTYYDLAPYVSGNTKNVDYTCIGENGKYTNFHLFSDDTSSLEIINGMRMIAGSWSLNGDTLKYENEKFGTLYDQNGLGPDWIQKISMTPIPTTLTLRVNLQENGLNYYDADGLLIKQNRQKPHELIKNVCQN